MLRVVGLLAPFAIVTGVLAPAVRADVLLPSEFVDDTVCAGFQAPTSFAFLPDGRALVVEQFTGRIRLVVNGQIAGTDPIFTLPDVATDSGERGLLGIAIDPSWPDLPYVYLNYSRQGGTQRIVRYLASDDVDVPGGQHITLSAPRVLIDGIADQFGNHNAGTLRFGPDGCLYVSLGDDAVFCDAADSTTLRGQILRLRVDQLPIYGGPMVPRAVITPPDNPFVASPDTNARLVYAFGMRNPFRFHIDPQLGDLFVADVGEATQEELSQVAPGDFLGWPWREGTIVWDRPGCPEPGGPGAHPFRGPIATLPHDEPIGYAIVSAGVYRPVPGGSDNWPPRYYTFRGDVFYTQFYDGKLRRLTWNEFDWVPAPPEPGQPSAGSWAEGLLWPVDFLVGPDGSLWWLQQYDAFFTPVSGVLHRIRYVGSPTAVGPTGPGTRALRVAPNPARGRSELTFASTVAGPARVEIYDVGGRRVRTLFDGPAAAGETRLAWSGEDDAGRPLEAGVYFARFERAGRTAGVARVMRLR